MKKLHVLLAVVITFIVLPSLSYSKDIATIRFGTSPDYPPFESKSPDGKLVGIDIDLGNAVCAQLHAKCEWVEGDFDGLIPSLKARKIDVILSGMMATEQRKKEIDFSDKLYSAHSRLLVSKASTLQPIAESLRGKSVGVLQGSVEETIAKAQWANSGVTVVPYANQDQALADLVNGRLDGVLVEQIQAGVGFLKTERGRGFKFAGGPIAVNGIADYTAMGLRKDDPSLRQSINDALQKIRSDGTYTTITHKYVDFDISN
ncbi:lysine/arginine/ornithine transporter subunit; periplasmic-binding component of ABC superfamily [Paraburkholderia piptadeniae]|uniref:Transporter substrate-binding domain-containing protein n=2 Tax=Paraburkholderia TaxID=1822464 RepID=A0A7X1NBD0_9BURK|nr:MULTISPECIES: transporter substrate-binding domain-containing protein [Paraburkholderia]MPW18694.1 transporter substrate-binding domain-containing protein [Paraburkholderia franconis]SIT52016.1 lysine/arginine/ornithine transporter subunit; periplasmic-binding component of ABC superfamily [Paraburkholderia piptadeniae]